MPVDKVKEGMEILRTVKSEPHFHRKQTFYGAAQSGKDVIDSRRIAKETATDVLSVHFRRRASEIEVDPCDGVRFKQTDRSLEVEQVLSDQLCKYWAPRRVFGY